MEIGTGYRGDWKLECKDPVTKKVRDYIPLQENRSASATVHVGQARCSSENRAGLLGTAEQVVCTTLTAGGTIHTDCNENGAYTRSTLGSYAVVSLHAGRKQNLHVH